MVLSRHRRDSLLATIQCIDARRKVVRGLRDGQDVLVVQSGCSCVGQQHPAPYGCDGSKAFGILDQTECDLVQQIGEFPFFSFWGPSAGLPCSKWIAEAGISSRTSSESSRTYSGLSASPRLRLPTLAGPRPTASGRGGSMRRPSRYRCGARDRGTGRGGFGVRSSPCSRAVMINRCLREAGFLVVRDGPLVKC